MPFMESMNMSYTISSGGLICSDSGWEARCGKFSALDSYSKGEDPSMEAPLFKFRLC